MDDGVGGAAEPAPAQPTATPDAERRPNPLRRTALIVVLVALVLFGLSVVMERLVPSTSQALVQAYVVRMAPEVGGQVVTIAVTDNAIAMTGDLLFEIDPRPYDLAVAEAEARLDLAGQSIGASTSGVDAAQAQLVEAEANRDNIREQAARVFELVERGVYPAARYDQAKAMLDSAEASVVGAEAELERARQELGPEGADNPQLREALAALEKARLDLLHTQVIAPSDGVVSNLQLSVGQVVGPGAAAMTFIDAQTVWIEAAFKENSLEHMTAGDPAEIVLDIFPGAVFPAKVESIGWGVSQESIDPATGLPTIRNQTGWVREPQRFPVRLTFEGDRPVGVRYGSQANVTVYTGESPILNVLGRLWIRLIAVLTYVS